MARLPQPGADNGTWGDILNEFLSQAHDDTGALKTNIITAQHIQNGAISTSHLDPTLQAAIANPTPVAGSIIGDQVQGGAITEDKLDTTLQTKIDNPTPADASVSYSKVNAMGTATAGMALAYDGTGLVWAAHGDLAGLSADDHTQYHTDARGDARYYQKQEVTDALATKADATHTHAMSEITGLQTAFTAIKTPVIVVASASMPQSVKDRADFVCDGVDDQVEINAALNMADRGPAHYGTGTEQGIVQLTGGTFTISSSVLMVNGVTLRGVGGYTCITGTVTDVVGSGSDKAMIKLKDQYARETRLQDMWVNKSTSFGGHLIQYTNQDDEGQGDFPFGLWPTHRLSGLDLGQHAFGDAINLVFCANVSIQDVNIASIMGMGINAYKCPRLVITNVVMRSIFDLGIGCVESSPTITNCVVNDCYNNAAYGIFSCDPCVLTGCTALNSTYGFMLSSPVTASGLIAVGSSIDGFRIANSSTVLNGCTAYNTGTGRFATSGSGFNFVTSSSVTDVSVTGIVRPANITNPVTGNSTGARNFVRISDGTTLVTRG